MPAVPEARLTALRLVNAEIQGRIDLQHQVMARVDTKLQAVVGFGAAAAAFLASGDLGAVPIFGIAVLVAACVVALIGLRPTTLKVVPEPRRMAEAYERASTKPNPEEVLLAALVPTKAEAFAISRRRDKWKVRLYQAALALLLLGVLISTVVLATSDGDTLTRQEPTSVGTVTGSGGG